MTVVRDATGRPISIGGEGVITDRRGDVIGAIGNDGSYTARSFSPFGSSSSDANGSLGYQGDYTSAGLVNMDARWYDPTSATFLTRDSVPLTVDEQNRYAYAMGNPLRYSDPTGHCAAVAAPVCGGLGGFAVAGPPGAAVGVIGGLIVLGVTAALAADAYNNLSWTWDSSSSSTTPSRASSSGSSTRSATYSIPSVGVSIPRISISVPDINITMPAFDFDFNIEAFHHALPRFGIDRPAWAYPDAFVIDSSTLDGAGASGLAAVCGSGPANCIAAIGTIGTSCASNGAAVTAACAPTLPANIWANEPVAGEAEGSNYGTNPNSSAGCQPGEVLTEIGCEDLLSLLQRKATEYRDRYSKDREARDEQLSRPEIRAERRDPFLQRLNNGKAIERGVGQDDLIRAHFHHRGGAGQPDFVSRSTGLFYELTTTNPGTIADHLRRSYVDPDRLATYVMWIFGK